MTEKAGTLAGKANGTLSKRTGSNAGNLAGTGSAAGIDVGTKAETKEGSEAGTKEGAESETDEKDKAGPEAGAVTGMDAGAESWTTAQPGPERQTGADTQVESEPSWAHRSPFSEAIRLLMEIARQVLAGSVTREIIDLIRLFLSELAETLASAPTLTPADIARRAHRQRGAAGSLHLSGFHHALNVLETAAQEGDKAMMRVALDDLGRLHSQAVAE